MVLRTLLLWWEVVIDENNAVAAWVEFEAGQSVVIHVYGLHAWRVKVET